MFRKTINPVKRRNSILIMAGVLLIIAIVNKPALLLFFISAQRFAGVALIAFAALLATLGIYNFVRKIFGRTSEPWYVKPRAMIFLVVVLIGINALLFLFDSLMSSIFGIGPFLSQRGYVYLFMAFELLWLVLFEWVSYEH